MTGTSVVNRAYSMIGDVGGTPRNSLADMAGFLTDGVRDLISRRQELKLNDDGTLDADIADIASGDLGNALSIPDNYGEGLAHYIAYRIFEIDAEDENNARMSQTHYQLYIRNT